jgi:hypothetical protein
MTILLTCMALGFTSPATCVRGGVAHPIERGGQATPVIVVRELPTFHAFVCIHGHEARWDDAGDPYWGGLQMDRTFMNTYGRDMEQRHHGGLANTWTPAEQIIVADRAHRTRGFGPWPNTRIPCGV